MAKDDTCFSHFIKTEMRRIARPFFPSFFVWIFSSRTEGPRPRQKVSKRICRARFGRHVANGRSYGTGVLPGNAARGVGCRLGQGGISPLKGSLRHSFVEGFSKALFDRRAHWGTPLLMRSWLHSFIDRAHSDTPVLTGSLRHSSIDRLIQTLLC